MSVPAVLESFARIGFTVRLGEDPVRVALIEVPPEAPRSPVWWQAGSIDQTPALVLLGRGRFRIHRRIADVRLRMESVQWTIDVGADAVVVAGDFFTNPTEIVRASIPWDVDDRRSGGVHAWRERLLHPNDPARADHPTQGAVVVGDGDALVHAYSTWLVRLC